MFSFPLQLTVNLTLKKKIFFSLVFFLFFFVMFVPFAYQLTHFGQTIFMIKNSINNLENFFSH